MDTPDKMARPWWRKKRWWALSVLWLLIAYPVSLWPLSYAIGRGWLPATTRSDVYGPIISATEGLDPRPVYGVFPADDAAEGYFAIADWFTNRGREHADSAASCSN